VKYEHQRSGDLLQRLEILEWKWDRITMDIVVGLPQTLKKFDAVWVIVDRLTKSTHFISVVTTYSSEKLAQIYIREIVRLHGVSVYMIFDRGTLFTLYFWRAVQRELGTQVVLSRKFQTSDRRSVRAHHSDLGGYALSLCYGFQGFMGSVSTACRVRLQQQLHIEYLDSSLEGLIVTTQIGGPRKAPCALLNRVPA